MPALSNGWRTYGANGVGRDGQCNSQSNLSDILAQSSGGERFAVILKPNEIAWPRWLPANKAGWPGRRYLKIDQTVNAVLS